MPSSVEDCYFYYYSTCAKGSVCPYRHCLAARGTEEVCATWARGKCANVECPKRHMNIQINRNTIACYWETQPTGCTKPHCLFKHVKPRPLTNGAPQAMPPANNAVPKPAVPAQPVSQPKPTPAIAPLMPPKPVRSNTQRPMQQATVVIRHAGDSTHAPASARAAVQNTRITGDNAQSSATGNRVARVPATTRDVPRNGSQHHRKPLLPTESASAAPVVDLTSPGPLIMVSVNSRANTRTVQPNSGQPGAKARVLPQPRVPQKDEDTQSVRPRPEFRQQVNSAQPQVQPLSLASLRERRTKGMATINSATSETNGRRAVPASLSTRPQVPELLSRKRPGSAGASTEQPAKRPKLNETPAAMSSGGVTGIKVKTLAEIRAEKGRDSSFPESRPPVSSSAGADPVASAPALLKRPVRPVQQSQPQPSSSSGGVKSLAELRANKPLPSCTAAVQPSQGPTSTSARPTSTSVKTLAELRANKPIPAVSSTQTSQVSTTVSTKPSQPTPVSSASSAQSQASTAVPRKPAVSTSVLSRSTVSTTGVSPVPARVQAAAQRRKRSLSRSEPASTAVAAGEPTSKPDTNGQEDNSPGPHDALMDTTSAQEQDGNADPSLWKDDDDDADITEMDDETFNKYMKERFGYDPATKAADAVDLDGTLENHDELLLDAESMI